MAIPPGVTDDTLLTRAREGDGEAFEALYHRHHRTARRAAQHYSPRNPLAEDAVQEAFLRILRATQEGAGPRKEFGGYLATTVRHVLAGWARADRTVATDDDEVLTDGDAPGPESRLHWHLLVRSFRSLPTRWQEALWLGEVEGHDIGELAERWNMTPSAASALTYRARDGLRTAWLEAHLAADRFPPGCRRYAVDLARWSRGRLGEARSAEIAQHVDSCEHCRAVVAELEGVKRGFGVALLPVAVWGGWVGVGAGAGGSLLLGKAALGFVGQSARRVVVVGSSVSAAAVVAIGGFAAVTPSLGGPAEPDAAVVTSPDTGTGGAMSASTDAPSADPSSDSSSAGPGPDVAATEPGSTVDPDSADPTDSAPGATPAAVDVPTDGDTGTADAAGPDQPDDPTTGPGDDSEDVGPSDGSDDGGGGGSDDGGSAGGGSGTGGGGGSDDGGPGGSGGPGDGDGSEESTTAPDPPSIEVARAGLVQLVVSGSAQPGADVTVTTSFGLGTQTTTAGGDGSWEVRFGLVGSLDGLLEISATQTVDGRQSEASTRRLNL